MATKLPAAPVERFLNEVADVLGEQYETWATSLAPGKKSVFGGCASSVDGGKERDWYSKAALGRGVLRDAATSVGLYLEPECFDDEYCASEGTLLEISVALPRQRRVYNAGVYEWLADELADELRHLECPFIYRYPNVGDARRPYDAPHVVEPLAVVDQEWADLVYVSHAELLPSDFLKRPILELEAVQRIQAGFSLFQRAVARLRGALGDRPRGEGVDYNSVLGWCGEYLWWRLAPASERGNWVGKFAPLDFRGGSGRIEVKSGVGAIPRRAFFSHAELRESARACEEPYRVARVAVPAEPLDMLFQVLCHLDASRAKRFSSSDVEAEEWEAHLSFATGLPLATLTGHRTLLAQLLADMVTRASTTAWRSVETSPFAVSQWTQLVDALGGVTSNGLSPRLTRLQALVVEFS